jgi:hypothetical protein
MTRTVQAFDSFQAFIDAAERGPSRMRENTRRSRGTDRQEFTWTATYQEAVDLARHGWPDGTARARVLTDAVVDKVSAILYREDWQPSHEGGRGDVDPERYAAGDPECVLAPVIVEDLSPRRAVHIVVNGNALGDVSASSMALRGAAAAALAELLVLAGYQVKVTLCGTSAGFKEHADWIHEVRVTVKDYQEHLDLARLTYAVGHPSTFRRHVFSLREQQSAEFRQAFKVGTGYGRTCDAPSDRGDIYIGGLAGLWSAERVASWIIQTLREQGVAIATPPPPPPPSPPPTPVGPPPPPPPPLSDKERREQEARWAAIEKRWAREDRERARMGEGGAA